MNPKEKVNDDQTQDNSNSTAENETTELSLLGSSKQPATFEEWNALSEDEREGFTEMEIATLDLADNPPAPKESTTKKRNKAQGKNKSKEDNQSKTDVKPEYFFKWNFKFDVLNSNGSKKAEFVSEVKTETDNEKEAYHLSVQQGEKKFPKDNLHYTQFFKKFEL